MTAINETRLAELLCARLCHDLAGPIGGAAAGAELLAEEEPCDPETVALVAASVTAASRHLRFLRAALGHGTQPFTAAELRTVAAGLFGDSGTLKLDWQMQTAPSTRDLGRLVLNLVMMARDALPRGGVVTVQPDGPPPGLLVTAAGPQINADDLLAALAAKTAETQGPRGAQAYYAGRLAERVGGRLLAASSPDRLALTLVSSG